MKFVEYVPDYILRNYLKVGQTVTILGKSDVRCSVPSAPDQQPWSFTLESDIQVVLTNFLPGYTEVYANEHHVHPVHDHQVVWKEGDAYYNTSINNVKEVRDAS